MTAVLALGDDVEVAPKKGYLSLRRGRQFAMIQPSGAGRIDVGLILPATRKPSPARGWSPRPGSTPCSPTGSGCSLARTSTPSSPPGSGSPTSTPPADQTHRPAAGRAARRRRRPPGKPWPHRSRRVTLR